jgi:hypothetical protein
VVNAGFNFVNWTEAGVEVSTSASYNFIADANRSLVANFAPKAPVLGITEATATRSGGKVYVTLCIGNSGGDVQDVMIARKKDATVNGKGTRESAPVLLGSMSPGASVTTELMFAGVKAGTRTLQVILTYTGGKAILSTPLLVP